MAKVEKGGKGVSTTVQGYSASVGLRIGELIDSVGSLVEAGKIAGVSDEQVARWRDGLSKPNLFGIDRLAKAAGKTVDWVMTGAYRDEVAPSITGVSFQEGSYPDLGMTLVPKLEVEASAGPGALASIEQAVEVVAFQSTWLRALGVNPSFARVITARGDSMEATIRDGDLLLVDTSVAEVRDNGIYCVIYGSMLLVKRINVRLNGSLQLISDNPIYPPEEVTRAEVSDISIAGRVMWFGRSI